MLNEADLVTLEKLKLKRFRHSFPSLTHAALCITLDNCLVIPCHTEAEVQALQADGEVLQHFSWLILGVDRLKIFLEQKLVWETDTRVLPVVLVDSPLVLKANDSRGDTMATATLERTTEARQLDVEMPAQPLRTVEELAAELAAITGRSLEEIRLEILSLNPEMYQFREHQLISPAVADAAIDRWSQQLKARLRAMPSSPVVDAQSNGAAPIAAPAPTTTAKKPAAKKTTTKTAAKKPAARKPAAEPSV